MAIRKLLSLTLALTACAASAADKDPCDGQDHLSEVRCAAAAVSRLNVKLTEAYQKALNTRPEQDDWDLRKTRDQLRKSQRAWLKYKEENCILIGGLEGGSNLWVTDFAEQCEKGEIEKRIEFLQRVASGEF